MTAKCAETKEGIRNGSEVLVNRCWTPKEQNPWEGKERDLGGKKHGLM